MENKLNIVIITGMSGAGKTVAIQSFEDMGYFTVDNMPPNLIEKFVGLLNTPDNKIDKVALVVDMRSRAFFEDIQKSEMEYLKEEYNLSDRNIEEIFNEYAEDFRDRSIVSYIYDK